MKTLINGRPGDSIAVQDRGLQYGDGLFETIALVAGKPLLWKPHVERLRLGCERLRIDMPDPLLLRDDIRELASVQPDGVIKIIITRGLGARGYRVASSAVSTRIVSLTPASAYPSHYVSSGVRVHLCRTHVNANPALAGIKHLNRLENVLARLEWDDEGIAEGLMLDAQGWVIEGVMSNVFLVGQGKLLTPDLTHCGVAGVMRERILQIAKQLGIAYRIEPVSLATLWEADEVFLCNSLIGIWPIRELAGTLYDTRPEGNPVSRRLLAEVRPVCLTA